MPRLLTLLDIFTWRRTVALIGGAGLLGGVIGWLTYVENDEPLGDA